jgi:hypothetical protein
LALKAIAKAWKINVETSPYDADFVAMVKKVKKRGNYNVLDIWIFEVMYLFQIN